MRASRAESAQSAGVRPGAGGKFFICFKLTLHLKQSYRSALASARESVDWINQHMVRIPCCMASLLGIV